MPHKIKKLFLLSGDIIVFYLSLYLTLQLRYTNTLDNKILFNHIVSFSILIIIWILVFYISGLYNLNLTINNSYFLKLLIRSFFISLIISFIFFYVSTITQITPKTNLIVFSSIFFILILLWRYIFNNALKSYLPKTKIAIIGLNYNTKTLIKIINKTKNFGYIVSFVFDEKNINEEIETNGIPIFTNAKKLKKLLLTRKIDTIILSNEVDNIRKIKSILFSCIKYKINLFSLNSFYENITGKISLNTINKDWFLENLNEGRKKWFNIFKRLIDIILATILFLIFVPFWPIIGIIIKIESNGKIFFTQQRIGKYGKIFTILKFRTMKIEKNNHTPTKKIDPRITKFGSFLRKTRLDEIPQIINILKGEMSFVGPRPERPELANNLEQNIPFYNERTLIKPGITGWDQVSGEYHSPSIEDTIKKLQYDLYYLKNRSIYLDISIILKTIATILSSKGR